MRSPHRLRNTPNRVFAVIAHGQQQQQQQQQQHESKANILKYMCRNEAVRNSMAYALSFSSESGCIHKAASSMMKEQLWRSQGQLRS